MHPSSGANGVATSVSTSPSIPTKKPPPILPPTSAMGNSTANGVSRTPARPRRDAPPQMLGRGQRTASAGLRSASLIPDIQTVQTAQPPPYSMDSYHAHVNILLTLSSSIGQLYLKEIPRMPCVSHCSSTPNTFPIRSTGWHVLLQIPNEDFH